MNHTVKRLIAVILAVLMTAGLMGTALAESVPEEYALNTSRLDDLPEGNLIYLGTASAAVEEKTATYSFLIYREGDLSDEAEVTLRTLDLSAVYGRDYVLLGSGIETTGSDMSLLERSAEAMKSYYDEDASPVSENSAPAAERRPSAEESSLARLVQEQTGEPTRDLYETSGEAVLTSIVNNVVPDQIQEIDYSAQMKVTFAPGESEKTVSFKILDDRISEGTEALSLLLVDPQGAELFMVTSLAVTINDNEPAQRSEVSFSSDAYTSENGTVRVTVQRSGAEYSACSFTIMSVGETAAAGVNYPAIQDDFFFSPYETERSFDIPVTGEGTFKLRMTDFAACKAGDYTDTKIYIEESAYEPDREETAQLQGSSDYSFTIKVNDKKYTVRYTMPSDYKNYGAAKGIIVDTDYTPELEVGEYFFSLDKKHGGMFEYGKFSGTDPGWRGTYANKYHFNEAKNMDPDERYGSLKYYSSWVRDKGTQSAISENVFPDYYQYFAPDWCSLSGFGGGQKFKIVYGSKSDSISGCGSFSRTQNNCAVRIDGMGIKEGHYVRVQAIDDTTGKTPKSYLEFYGVAAMYKKINVSVETPNALTYRLGDMNMQSLAMQAHLKSGAQVLYSGSRDFYANPDASKTNLVVNLDSTALNGHTGIFGHVTGFKLTITGSDNSKKKTVNYPDDFVTFLNDNRTDWKKGEAKISGDTIDGEIKRVKDNPAVIPYDRFFFAWLEDVQSNIVKDGSGYYQKLSIRPIVTYNNITVEVLDPTLGAGTGSFTAANLSKGAYTYHAGDTLNLSAAAADPSKNRVIGYEVSVDGGVNFNTITDTKYLFLEPGKDYYKIRPVISPIRNKIEIVFTDEAAKHLSADGLFTEDYKASNDVLKEFKGQNILNANPSETTALGKLEPVKGRIYTINFACEENDTSIYLPVIKAGSKTYCTNTYYHVGAGDVADNVINVDCVQVNKSELKSFTVSGTLMSNFAPIRTNGMASIPLPVVGYTVTASTNTQSADGLGKKRPMAAVSLSGDDGVFTLSGIMGRSGDVIPILVSNGVTNGQVSAVTLGADLNTNAGEIGISYPYGAPYVMDEMVTCEYTMEEFKQNFDTRENQIRIVDDKLKLSANVNLNGCPLDSAVFTVYTMDGIKTEYRASVTKTDGELAVFECTTDKMTEVLHAGDRVCVRLEYVGDDPDAPTVSYPDVDSGFMFYTANDLVVPKTIEANGMKVDIPVIGASTAHMKSGLLNFNTVRWADAEDGTPTGYSIYVNVDVLLDHKGKLTDKEAVEALKKLNNSAKNSSRSAGGGGLAGAEGIFEDMEDPLEVLNPDRDDDMDSWRDSLRDRRQNMTDAKDAMGGIPFKWTVDIVLLLSFDFVYDKEQDEYILLCGTAIIGGTFECSKTWYTALMGVPVFLNVKGKVQIDAVVSYPFPEGENAYNSKDFANYTGNLADWLPETKADILLNLTGKVTVGVGMSGVASAGGYIAVNLQCDFPIDGKGRSTGELLNIGGGLHFDVIVASLDLTIAEYTQGWGTLQDAASFNFLNGLYKTKVPSKSFSAADAQTDGAVLVVADGNETVTARPYDSGTGDMSRFGQRSYAVGGASTAEQVLLYDSAERSSPQILALDDKRQLMVFLGSNNGTQMLFYSVFDGDSWSEPQLVADDGTMDVMPELDRIGNRVLIAWTDANAEFEDGEDLDSMLGKLGISCAIYDPETNVMMNKMTLTNDEYANLNPKICSDGENAYITYMKRDLTNREVRLQDADDLLDVTGIYSVMATVKLNLNYGIVVPDGNGNSESYNTVQHPTLADPLVLDHNTTAVKVGEGSWLLETYTVDTDGNLTDTIDDRELYLGITSASNDVKYRPIRITADAESPSAPRLTKMGDEVWLSWLSEGYIFHMADITDLLCAMFTPVNDTEEDSVKLDTYAVASAYWEADASDWDWYKKTAADLSMTEEQFEDSIYDDLSKGVLCTYTTTFWKDDALQSASDSYRLVSDGTDIYVFFTAYDQDPDNSGLHLCAIRFQKEGAHTGFGSAVRLTGGDRVYDQLDISMLNDTRTVVAANCYDNKDDGNGGVYKGDNSLILLNLLPACTLKVPKESCAVLGELFEGGVANVRFTLENSGLLDADGYDVTAALISGGERTEIGSVTEMEPILGGESMTLDIGWEVSSDLAGAQIEISAAALDENGDVIGGRSYTTVDVPYAVQLSVGDLSVERGENNGDAHLTATIRNEGSRAASETTIKLEICDKNGDAVRTIDAGRAESLAPGETKAIDVSFTPLETEYNRFGYVDVRLTAASSEDSSAAYAKVIKSDLYAAQTASYDGPEPTPVPLPSGGGGGGGGGGSSAAANPISVSESGAYGFVRLSSQSARAGDTVTITPEPAEGYRTAGVSVTDADGNAVAVTENGDGTYSFTMPQKAVSITPEFEKIRDPDDSSAADRFIDVPETAWYRDAVQWAVDNGVMNGVSVDMFAPDDSATRAMAVTMLWRMAGEPAADFVMPYTDVSDGLWYTEAIRWAASTGIVTGTTETSFSPDEHVTREQLAAILYRSAKAQGKGFTGLWAFRLDYADADEISEYAYEPLCWMTMHGVINGMGDGTLAPKAEATRAQIAAMFMRFAEETADTDISAEAPETAE
ncbi:MAG: S-layer homology domain-containing protein [Clostridia bacterium]|nr:S-layer homology domain-containing protein [Clostridia bacterium]